MPLTDTIGADLRAMAAEVHRSQQETAAAEHAIEQIATRAVASGFAGIAVGLARVRKVLGQARSQLAEAGGILSEASRSMAAVVHQPSPQEAITALTPVVATLATVDGRIAGAAAAIDGARRHVTAVLQGGQPAPTLARLQQILHVLAAARSRGLVARQHVDTALAQARQIGELGKIVTGGGRDTSRPPNTPGISLSPPEAPASSEPLPEWVTEAARDLPRRQAKEPTSGVALIGGKRISMKSGRDSAAAADLKPAYQLIATTTDHLEAKLAARMRRERVTHAAVITNNPPCDYTPYGCEKILPRLLPAGAQLVVYVRDDDGQVRHWRTYTGNGKAIA